MSLVALATVDDDGLGDDGLGRLIVKQIAACPCPIDPDERRAAKCPNTRCSTHAEGAARSNGELKQMAGSK
jgi:hypothetical protein